MSKHGTVQEDGDVQDMMAAEEEELLARSLVFRAIVAPVVTRSGSNAAPRVQGVPPCNPPPRAPAPVGEGKKRK